MCNGMLGRKVKNAQRASERTIKIKIKTPTWHWRHWIYIFTNRIWAAKTTMNCEKAHKWERHLIIFLRITVTFFGWLGTRWRCDCYLFLPMTLLLLLGKPLCHDMVAKLPYRKCIMITLSLVRMQRLSLSFCQGKQQQHWDQQQHRQKVHREQKIVNHRCLMNIRSVL